VSWGRSFSSRRAASSQRAAAWSSGWRRWWSPWVAWVRVCERDGQGGGGRRRRAVVGTALRTPLRSIARQARRSAASSGHLLWSRPKASRALPTERPYVMRGAPRGRGYATQHEASDEHEVAASSPCAPRGRASRAAAAPRRSRPCRPRACASGPRSRCGASTCAFASHVSMRRKRSLRTGRAGDIFGQMGRRGDNTPLSHGT
jgi:hypothetical protein